LHAAPPLFSGFTHVACHDKLFFCNTVEHSTILEEAVMANLENTRQALGDSFDKTGRRARRIAHHGRHALQDVGTEVRELLSELENTLTDSTQADAEVLRQQLRDKIEAARSRLEDTQENVKRRAQAAWGDADEYVHERPWQAVAAAAGVALLLGLLLGRA
jgi:ElaB/YqjD/DUF883 family membrane-anchored ribosome-binding protein